MELSAHTNPGGHFIDDFSDNFGVRFIPYTIPTNKVQECSYIEFHPILQEFYETLEEQRTHIHKMASVRIDVAAISVGPETAAIVPTQ